MYQNLADTWDTRVSKTGSPSRELRVARAAVPNRCKNIPIRVMNVTRYPVTVAIGAVLADFEAVEIVRDLMVPAGAEGNGETPAEVRNQRVPAHYWMGSIPRCRSRLEKLCVAC